jgi:hypothetical protein
MTIGDTLLKVWGGGTWYWSASLCPEGAAGSLAPGWSIFGISCGLYSEGDGRSEENCATRCVETLSGHVCIANTFSSG